MEVQVCVLLQMNISPTHATFSAYLITQRFLLPCFLRNTPQSISAFQRTINFNEIQGRESFGPFQTNCETAAGRTQPISLIFYSNLCYHSIQNVQVQTGPGCARRYTTPRTRIKPVCECRGEVRCTRDACECAQRRTRFFFL